MSTGYFLFTNIINKLFKRKLPGAETFKAYFQYAQKVQDVTRFVLFKAIRDCDNYGRNGFAPYNYTQFSFLHYNWKIFFTPTYRVYNQLLTISEDHSPFSPWIHAVCVSFLSSWNQLVWLPCQLKQLIVLKRGCKILP